MDHAHHSHHAHHGAPGKAAPTLARLTTSATLHCLTGCAIGVSFGIGVRPTMALATQAGADARV